MSKPLKFDEPTVRRLELTEPTVRRLDPAAIVAALGAEPTGERVPHAGPLTLYAVRSELYRRLSTAGRVEAGGTDRGDEVAISPQDWARLKALASKLQGPNASPSAGQVASALLSVALDTVEPAVEPGSDRPDPALAKKLAEKVGSQT